MASRRVVSISVIGAVAAAGALLLLVPHVGVAAAAAVWVLGALLFSNWYRTSTPLSSERQTLGGIEREYGSLMLHRPVGERSAVAEQTLIGRES